MSRYVNINIDAVASIYYYIYVTCTYTRGHDFMSETQQLFLHCVERDVSPTVHEVVIFPGVSGEPVPITSEEDIFDYIDYPFKKPEERNL